MFDWDNVPEDFTEIPPEEREKALLNSRMVDRVAKMLRVPRHQIAERIEQMVAEREANRDKISVYENPPDPSTRSPVLFTS